MPARNAVAMATILAATILTTSASAQELPSVDDLFKEAAQQPAAPESNDDEDDAEDSDSDEAGEEEAEATPEAAGLPPAQLPVDEDAAPAAQPEQPQTTSPAPQTTLGLVHTLTQKLRAAERDRYTDLTPVVDSPQWWQAHSLLRENKCRKALPLATKAIDEAYPTDRSPWAQYALARFELCGGRAADGKHTLKALAALDHDVSNAARHELGMPVRLATPQTEAQKTAKRTLDQDLQSFVHDSRHRPDVAKLEQQFDAIRARGLSRNQWLRATLAMAQRQEVAKNIEEAARLWRGAYERARGKRGHDEIARQIARFERRHKHKVLSVDVRIDDMIHAIGKKKYKQARTLNALAAKQARLSGSEVKGWSLMRQGMEAERRRKRDDAIALYERANPLIKHPAMRARLYNQWGKSLRRVDRDPEAIAMYKTLCKEHPTEHKLCAEGLYQAARLLQYENKLQEAFDTFFELAGMYPESRRMPEAIWRAALCAYLLGQYEPAQGLLAQLQQRWPRKRDASGLALELKAQYWMGVVALKQGDQEQAKDQLHKAFTMAPLTWYGRLAHARLTKLGAPPALNLPNEALTLGDLQTLGGLRVPKDPRLGVAAPMIRAGFYDDAYAQVRHHVYSRGVPLKKGRAILAALRLALGDHTKAHWMASKLLGRGGPTAHNVRTWATSFPLVFIQHIHKYAQTYNVHPMLVQAVMRQESGFRPKVKSYAGALGLMQLMPGTARYVARVFLDDEDYRAKHIWQPETNIKLGSMYIRMHTAFASDRVPLALAGYNAGPAPLKRWFKDYGHRELDAWVESITYAQARGYVRKVMTSYITYSALYTPDAIPVLELEMPKSLRRWGVIPGQSGEKISALPPRGPQAL